MLEGAMTNWQDAKGWVLHEYFKIILYVITLLRYLIIKICVREVKIYKMH
jgi:hypothetical protein